MSVLFFLIPLVVAVAALGWFTQRRMSERGRAGTYADWAARNGLQYWTEDPLVGRPSAAAPFEVPFGSLHDWQGRHVFRGVRGRHHFLAYECTRFKDAFQVEEPDRIQVVAVPVPALVPFLDISREHRDSVDLDFENQAFNDKFRVVSASPRFAHDVLDPRMMEWMLHDPWALASRWRFETGWLMTFRPGPLAPGEILPCVDFLVDVMDRVPAHVWSRK